MFLISDDGGSDVFLFWHLSGIEHCLIAKGLIDFIVKGTFLQKLLLITLIFYLFLDLDDLVLMSICLIQVFL